MYLSVLSGRSGLRTHQILISGMVEATGWLRKGRSRSACGAEGVGGEAKEMKALQELWGTSPTDPHRAPSWWLTGPAPWLCSHVLVFNLFEPQFLHLGNGM